MNFVFLGMGQKADELLFADPFWKCRNNTAGEPFMAPVGQYVFAEMQWITEPFTAGSHEWPPTARFRHFQYNYNGSMKKLV